MEIEKLLARMMRLTMEDIRVECDDEFQQNFQREAFFNEKWKRRKHDDGSGRKLLHGAGSAGVHLSQSLFPGKIQQNTITYTSTLPYAAIHNDGGVIIVTAKMRRYFWAKYISATGAITYKKNGERRATQKNRRLDADAEFYKAMALKKVGSKIVIPRRRFIGTHPELEKRIIGIIEKNLTEFFEENDFAKVITK